jgi:hypothetical protein
MNNAACLSIPAAVLALSCHWGSAQAQTVESPTRAAAATERLHTRALASLRQGRFSEAYGRLIGLADAGYAPSAELALWMYQHGTSVFGKDWDSTPEQLKAWAQTAGQPAQEMLPSTYPKTLVAVADRRR